MSRTKGVHIRGRLVWVLDNSHDVVVARMVEAAEGLGSIDGGTLEDWRVWASVGDLAFTWDGEVTPALLDVLAAARVQVEHHGDVVAADLVGWSVLDGVDVSDGFLRYDVLPVAAVLDTLDGLHDLLLGGLPPDPPEGWWLLGVPGGRQVLPRRR